MNQFPPLTQPRLVVILAAGLIAGVLAPAVSAQSVDFTRFRFGFQLSPSVSWMTTDDNAIDGDGTALGLKLGTVAEYNFAENYALVSGIGFHFNAGGTLRSGYGGRFFTESIADGEDFNDGGTQPGVGIDYSITYVEIPLGLKLRTREFGYLTYTAEAPVFTLNIRSNARGSLSGGGEVTEVEDITIKDEVALFALSWGFGGGAEYSVSESTRLFGGLRFQRVFTDVTKDGDYYDDRRATTDDPRAGINMITLRLGVLF